MISTAHTRRNTTIFSFIGRLHGRDYKIKRRVHQTNTDHAVIIVIVIIIVSGGGCCIHSIVSHVLSLGTLF